MIEPHDQVQQSSEGSRNRLARTVAREGEGYFQLPCGGSQERPWLQRRLWRDQRTRLVKVPDVDRGETTSYSKGRRDARKGASILARYCPEHVRQVPDECLCGP